MSSQKPALKLFTVLKSLVPETAFSYQLEVKMCYFTLNCTEAVDEINLS